jgi:UDP-glucose:(heptosyl)LPS alpha-1,3-glucosyltransferase
MRKIAVVIPKYGMIGGAEQFAAELTERLVSQTGYDFHIYINRRQSQKVGLTFHKVPIISFPKFLTTLSFAYFAQRQLNRSNFSLIHSHERIFAADIFTLHGIPHRYWVQNVRRKKMSLYDRATDWVEKKLVYNGNCKKFIAVSNLTKDIFLREYSIDPGKIEVINPGVDMRDYSQQNRDLVRRSIRKELGINAYEPVILFASMNFEIKGLDAVLLSLAKLKAQGFGFKLIVAGKGNINKYKKMAQEAQIGSEIIFTGPVIKERLIQMYLAGDLYIMLSKFDTFGMVVLEAMAAGLPAIISSNVGAKDIVDEGKNGFVIKDAADSSDITNKIRLLLDNNVRRPMAESALEAATKNSWAAVAFKYQKIYTGVIAEKKNVL